MPGIFVSYRPNVTKTAARLSRELIERYGRRVVVDLDRPDIALPGYPDFIRHALQDSSAMLALLGPYWFEPLEGWENEYGNPTLFELWTARHLGIPVIPVFVGRPTLPPSTPPFLSIYQLMDKVSLSSLRAKPPFVINALDQFEEDDLLRVLPSGYRRLDLDELIGEIGGLVSGLEKPAPGPKPRRSEVEKGSSGFLGSRPDRRRLGPMVEVAPEVRPDVRRVPGPIVEVAPEARPDVRRAPGPIVEVAPELRPDVRRADDVRRPSSPADFSVIAPGQIQPGLSFVVEVWVAPRDQRDAMLAQALKPGRMLEAASRQGVKLESGTPIKVILRLPDLEINGAAESMGWNGDIGNVAFIVKAPDVIAPGTYPGAAKILQSGIPIVDISFELTVAAPGAAVVSSPAPLASKAERILRAFASYATGDRVEVLKRTQAAGAFNASVFIDVFDLRNTDDWERSLFQELENSDRFLLFWSSRAAKSKWVKRELKHALEKKGMTFIWPVPLEPPIVAPPPKELKAGKQFDAVWSTLIEGEKSIRAKRHKPSR